MTGRRRAIDRSEIFGLEEIKAVADYARHPRRGRRPENIRALAIFRLATCCGLRAGEVAGIDLAHIHTGIQSPYIEIPGTVAKRGRSRRVPLTWDAGTLTDVERYVEWRKAHAAAIGGDARVLDLEKYPAVCRLRGDSAGDRMNPAEIRKCYLTLVRKALGAKRAATVTTHTGRHTFASWAATRVDLPKLRDALGHADLSTTSIYAHVVPRDEVEPTIFDADAGRPKRDITAHAGQDAHHGPQAVAQAAPPPDASPAPARPHGSAPGGRRRPGDQPRAASATDSRRGPGRARGGSDAPQQPAPLPRKRPGTHPGRDSRPAPKGRGPKGRGRPAPAKGKGAKALKPATGRPALPGGAPRPTRKTSRNPAR